MAITWRNMGQSNNSGNSLISGASDTIASGLKTIQSAAQSVTDEQIRQYDTQADINTAGILSDIGSLDQDGIDSFNINSLSSQFGSQYDSTQIANALDGRVSDLQDAAQQTLQNDRAGQRLDSQLATDKLSRINTQDQIDLRNEAQSKTKAFNNFSNTQTMDLANKYSSADDIVQKVTKAGKAAGMSAQEIDQAITTTQGLYNKNFNPTAEMSAKATARKDQLNDFSNKAYETQLLALQNDAKTRGLNLDTVNLNSKASPEEQKVLDNSIAGWNDQVAGNDKPWGEQNTKQVESLMTKDLGRKVTIKELEYFLPFIFQEGTLSSDYLNFEKDNKQWSEYKDQELNKSGEMQDYNNAKLALDVAKNTATKNNEDRFKELSKNFTQKRKDIFNEVSGARDRVIVPDAAQLNIPDELTTRDWWTTPKPENKVVDSPKFRSKAISDQGSTRGFSRYRSTRESGPQETISSPTLSAKETINLEKDQIRGELNALESKLKLNSIFESSGRPSLSPEETERYEYLMRQLANYNK